MPTPATALQPFEAPEYEQIKSPFQKAVEEWFARMGASWKHLIIDPNNPGLQGRMAFDPQAIEQFLQDQFHEFWKSLSEQQKQIFGRNNDRMGWRLFFIETATTMFNITLMHGIERGVIAHPDGKITGTERAGMPGSLENDTARARGSMMFALGNALAERLKNSSSGDAEEDKQFMDALMDYLGLDIDRANALMSRVLDHHGIPNIHKAQHHYGALLKTALLQCHGSMHPYWRTTPEEVIPDQMQKYRWPAAYCQLPLLDVVLGDSLWFYDPVNIRAFHDDLKARHPETEEDPFGPNIEARCQQGQRIIDALQAFRARLLGGAPQIAGGAQRLLVD
ncbi:hypothetical protein IPG41_05180 [Candidatus Peregrinibacteria bacterium]|nr:MAG: hypothetical protein IPG41_05180 [Candidatus Peregrinibacteria bacterium]